MSKRKVNIRPDQVGELFIDGNENIYRLMRCDTEPLAYMKKIGGDENELEKPISYFAHFVQLKPVRPIEKPKKTRSDKGTRHRTSEKTLTHETTPSNEDITQDILQDNLTIHVPTGMKGDTEYRVDIAGYEAITPQDKGLKFAIFTALEEWSGKIPSHLSEQERATIQGILDSGE